MKQTDNDKMDLLLRGLAKREEAGAALPGAFEDQSHTDHLDADELSSYAERALPDVTRARYTAHLADCTSCRKIVTELTLASGASLAGSRFEEPASATLWEKFSAFFSLPVLRYAVPALALSGVLAITFIVFREGRQASFVVRNRELPAAESVAQSKEISEQVAPAETPAAPMSRKQPSESGRIADTHEDKKNKSAANKLAEKEKVAQGDVAANSGFLAAAKDSPTAKVTDAATQPTFAPEPPPAPASKEQAKPADARRADEARQQEQVAERDAAAGRRENQVRAGDKAERTAAAPQSQDATLARKRVGGVSTGQARRPEGAGANIASSNEDVRTVAGRRFRRQGQTWVDTAYDASRSAIGVARGSEQYRALIADEPGIRTVAEQLQGEVILVWQGRTYRIR